MSHSECVHNPLQQAVRTETIDAFSTLKQVAATKYYRLIGKTLSNKNQWIASYSIASLLSSRADFTGRDGLEAPIMVWGFVCTSIPQRGRQVMLLHTTRFGTIQVDAEDVFLFPHGLIGLEDFRRWVLLADAENEAVGWLQSTSHPDIAVAVVSPRRFVPHYQVRVSRNDLEPLQLDELDRAFVLSLVSRSQHGLTLNLKAPVLFNLDRRLASQVVTTDDQPLQWDLTVPILKLRKSA